MADRKYDYVIVGSGLTGSVLARLLIDAGRTVIVLDRRDRAGGNVADAVGPGGIRAHLYGPHFFRTVSRDIWQFVHRFASFHKYRHQIKSRVDGQLENWPIAASYIRRACGDDWKPEHPENGRPTNFEEAALSHMPRVIYEKFVKGYTEKQWGVPARSLAPGLCTRFDVRHDDNPYLHPKHAFQGIPSKGYSHLIRRMLHGIPLVLNFDYLQDQTLFRPRKLLIFTGPIDEYFGFQLGKLAYRGQRRTHRYYPHTEQLQPCAQVNEPGEAAHIRDIEWNHLLPPDHSRRIRGTLVTRETPWSPDRPEHYEYPVPDQANQDLYQRYRLLAAEQPDVLICGRLGEYRYYDMDHAIGRAMAIGRKIFPDQPA